MELLYDGHIGTTHKCPIYQGDLIFKVSLFGTITKWVDHAGVPIFKCPD